MQKRDPLDSAVPVMSVDGHRRSTPLGGSGAQLRLPRAQSVSSWPTFYPALQWCQGLTRYLSPRNRSSAQRGQGCLWKQNDFNVHQQGTGQRNDGPAHIMEYCVCSC